MGMEIRLVHVDRIIALRHAVLCRGRHRKYAHFEGDAQETTMHIGAVIGKHAVGCLTILDRPFNREPAWQLHGMAVDPLYQGWGIGRSLLSFADTRLRQIDTYKHVWCNAYLSAIPFYEKFGWVAVSEEFKVPNMGPHRTMLKKL
jgi:GNAT superfamily N-acetyltransferase